MTVWVRVSEVEAVCDDDEGTVTVLTCGGNQIELVQSAETVVGCLRGAVGPWAEIPEVEPEPAWQLTPRNR